MEFGVTNPDLRDLGHMCVLDSINFAQFKLMSYISVGTVAIPFLGHFGTAESLTDRHRSAGIPANHGVISGQGFVRDPRVNSIALDHIYRTYIASGSTRGTSHGRQSQISHFCVACWEGVHKSLYAPDWGAILGDHPQMVPSNRVLNRRLNPWVSDFIYHHMYFEFGNI